MNVGNSLCGRLLFCLEIFALSSSMGNAGL